MTLIEAVIGTALILIVFLSIYTAFKISLDLVFSTKAATGATALINERMEYIRGLEYDAVGTSGGIPSGSIPQVEQKTLNGVPYTLSTLIQYVDDPADGTGGSDTTTVTADYKSVRVEASWAVRGKSRSSFALTRIAPQGIETLASGGTLRVNVFNVSAAPVAGATVRIVNAGVSPAVDVSVVSASDGSVIFPGTPPGAGYQITVSKSGYGSAQTYAATTQNPNPSPGHVSVVNKTTTTVSMQIDPVGALTVSTWSPKGPATFSDTFPNAGSLSATTNTEVAGGSLILSGGAGAYAPAGSARSNAVTPSYLSNWDQLSWNASTSAQAALAVHLYYWNGTAFVLVPDADLPLNSTGLSSPVSLSALPAATYGTLQIAADLNSSDVLWTPEVKDWALSYVAGPTPLPGADFSVRGSKTIGTTAGGTPIYKFNEIHTTTSQGTWVIDPSEADGYTLSLPSGSAYAISEYCPVAVSVAPSASTTVSLTLAAATTNSLRAVVTANGAPLPGASMTLTGNSVNQTLDSSACGQAFFSGIPAGTYTLTVTKSGYQPVTDTNVSVTGQSVYSLTMNP